MVDDEYVAHTQSIHSIFTQLHRCEYRLVVVLLNENTYLLNPNIARRDKPHLRFFL